MRKFYALLSLSGLCCLLLLSCQQDVEAPPLQCESAQLYMRAGETLAPLFLSSNNLFRQDTDTGGYKLLSLEAYSDSIKMVINVIDGPYHDHQMLNDSLAFKTYHYSAASRLKGGLVMVGVREGKGYRYLQTDSSSVTIIRMNIKKQLVSGSFYVEAEGRSYKGEGRFTNACYVSL